jgi:hypothetical protein
VEAAVALPLLLLVALALVQFALVVHAHGVVLGAVQDGARVAAAADRSLGEGIDHAQAVLLAGLGSSARVDVSGSRSPSGAPEVVEVTAVAYLRPIVPWRNGATIPVGARAAVSKERFRAR